MRHQFHIDARTHTHTHTHTHTRMHTRAHTHAHCNTHARTHARTHTHTHSYYYYYTHTHTLKHNWDHLGFGMHAVITGPHKTAPETKELKPRTSIHTRLTPPHGGAIVPRPLSPRRFKRLQYHPPLDQSTRITTARRVVWPAITRLTASFHWRGPTWRGSSQPYSHYHIPKLSDRITRPNNASPPRPTQQLHCSLLTWRERERVCV